MHLIVCIEDNGGLSFCGRRLSSDRVVVTHITQVSFGSRLWMNSYSAGLFGEQDISVDESFLEKAGAGDFCFLENSPLSDNMENVETVIVFRWNRRYPSTTKLPAGILKGREMIDRKELAGYSHERITVERYR